MFFKPKVSFIIAGLGNPGPEYQNTRHNCGFSALDGIAEHCGARVIRRKFSGLTGIGELAGCQVLLLKPLTYMNLSGQAVAAAARFYKLPPERVIVLCDDIALPCGTIRIRPHGSAGGHNGLKSIISCLGSEDFPRIRIGVGAGRGADLKDYVLDRPSKQQQKLIESRRDDIISASEYIVRGEIEKAMSEYNAVNR